MPLIVDQPITLSPSYLQDFDDPYAVPNPMEMVYNQLLEQNDKKHLDTSQLFKSVSSFLENIMTEQSQDQQLLEFLSEQIHKLEKWDAKISDSTDAKNNIIKTQLLPQMKNKVQTLNKYLNEKQREYQRDQRELNKIMDERDRDLKKISDDMIQYKDLLENVVETMSSESELDYWRTLERIDSQIAVGLFKKTQKNNDIFSQLRVEIDQILSQKNFTQQYLQISKILSFIKSCAMEAVIQYKSEKLKLDLDYKERIRFYDVLLVEQKMRIEGVDEKIKSLKDQQDESSAIYITLKKLQEWSEDVEQNLEDSRAIVKQIMDRKKFLDRQKLYYQKVINHLSQK